MPGTDTGICWDQHSYVPALACHWIRSFEKRSGWAYPLCSNYEHLSTYNHYTVSNLVLDMWNLEKGLTWSHSNHTRRTNMSEHTVVSICFLKEKSHSAGSQLRHRSRGGSSIYRMFNSYQHRCGCVCSSEDWFHWTGENNSLGMDEPGVSGPSGRSGLALQRKPCRVGGTHEAH